MSSPHTFIAEPHPSIKGFTDVDLKDTTTTTSLKIIKIEDSLFDQSWATPIEYNIRPPLRSWRRSPLVYVGILAIGTSMFVGAAVLIGLATSMLKKGLAGRNPLEGVGGVMG